jgi:hypothetical protein
MNAASYGRLAAALFALIAVLQLLRALLGWPVSVNGVAIPVWASWVAFAVSGALSALGWRAADRR